MSFWISVAALTAVTLYFLSRPLRKNTVQEAERADFDLTIFKDQLNELDRDFDRGLISEEEAKTARLEIQRRLLNADQARQDSENATQKIGTGTLAMAAMGGVVLMVATAALYLNLGSPGYEDMPFAQRDIQKERQVAAAGQGRNMDAEIVKLQDYISQNPTDGDAWVLLARTLRKVGRDDEALQAFEGALKATDRHPALLADYAEARIFTSNGAVTQETFALLQESMQKDPTMMKARFYMGFAQARAEDYYGAVQTWTDVLALAPAEAPWIPQVQAQIAKAAQAGEFDPATISPSPQIRILAKQLSLEWGETSPQQATAQPGPTREQMRDAQDMSAEDREVMIRSMVQRLADRLKENPDDVEGWKRLVQVYGVLGETEKQAQAKAMLEKLTN